MMFITQCSLASTTSKSGFHQLIHCWLVLTLIEYLTRTFDFSRNMNSTVKVCVFLAVFVSFDVIGNAFNFEGWFHYWLKKKLDLRLLSTNDDFRLHVLKMYSSRTRLLVQELWHRTWMQRKRLSNINSINLTQLTQLMYIFLSIRRWLCAAIYLNNPPQFLLIRVSARSVPVFGAKIFRMQFDAANR